MTTALLARDPAYLGEVEVPGPPAGLEQPGGGWPRMLVLDEETESRLVEFLDHEIMLAWQEKGLLVEDWIQWQRDYWAKPTEKVKNFPFRRAANVVIPMTAIAVETIYARLLTTLFSVKPFYSVRPRTKMWIEAAPNVEGWLQTEVEDPNALDMDGFARESILELLKLGTGIGKSGYERDIRKVNIDQPGGGSTPRYITRKDSATLDYVPCANFLMRLSERDPQTAVWVGEEHNDITWAQLKRHALSGRMSKEAVENVKAWWQNGDTNSKAKEYDTRRREIENTEPAWTQDFSFIEVWISFDVDGDGVDEEIVVDFHRDSRTILSARYNWYADAHRPYRIGVYIPVEGRWAGIGVGKQLEQFQPLITTVHRQRLDAGTLANMGQLAIKRGQGYSPDEPIFPGKMWFLDNPGTDIKEFSLSNTQHFQYISNEDNARQYADKRSGANELIIGTPQQGTPAPFSTDYAKLTEGNKKFDMVLKNIRRWFGLLGGDCLANYQQFGGARLSERIWLARGEGGMWVEQVLRMPQENVRRGAIVELTVTDSITNRDVEQAKWNQLFALLTGHYDKVLERAMQVASITQDPSVFLLFAQMSLRASNNVMNRLLDTYVIPDKESFNLDPKDFQDALARGGGGIPTGNGAGAPGVSAEVGGNGSLAPTGVSGGGTSPGGRFSIDEG